MINDKLLFYEIANIFFDNIVNARSGFSIFLFRTLYSKEFLFSILNTLPFNKPSIVINLILIFKLMKQVIILKNHFANKCLLFLKNQSNLLQ